MKWDIFKKLVKKEIHDYSSEVDLMDIWKAIEPEVDALNQSRKKKCRGIIWWIALGLLVLVSVGYWYASQQSKGIETEMSVAESNDKSILPSDQNDQLSIQPLPGKASKPLDGLVSKDQENALNASSLLPKEQAERNESLRDQPGSSQQLETTESRNLPGEEKQEDVIVLVEKDVPRNGESAVRSEKAASSKLTGTFQEELTAIQEGKENTESGEEDMKSTSEINGSGNEGLKMAMFLELQTFTPVLATTEPTVAGLFKPLEEKLAQENTPKRNHRNSLFSVGVGVFGGGGLVSKNLFSKEGYDEPLLAIREASESTLEANHFGALITVRHRSGLEVATGIQQTTINERFDYQERTVEELMVEGVQSRLIDINGDTVDIMGAVPLTRTTDYSLEVYNTYRLVEIPILVGYSTELGDWRIGAQAGVFANLSLTTEGQILKDPGVFWDLDTEQDKVFQNSIGLSYQVGFSVRRTLFSDLEISLSPYARFYPSDFTIADYSLAQKYTLVGANVGLTYWFGGR